MIDEVSTPPAVEALARHLRSLGWVTDLFVGGSAATGDHRPGVSDLDLVALVDRPIDGERRSALVAVHRDLDARFAEASLGCIYVVAASLFDPVARHPTWTHGALVDRALSGIVRAELDRHGFAVLGRPPQTVLPPMSDDDVRRAAQAELTGYWAAAVCRPWWWLDPVITDLGLTSMARGRHALATGSLLTKTAAIEVAEVPEWLRSDLRARRDGSPAKSPRLRTAWIAWCDARRTTAAARRWRPSD
ncbi:nucleotidyltransferase domain-containing protein [Nocardioides dongkuii]|uniref:nucleotidyltransferase domain-containing protein n=1 Tax=Nocardioides dongkuii TaxID=2760089 RepID=UPI0015FCCB85|nr:nucleotidyltransferase domain-containing protein [Nocardioides dongkuii]